MLHRKPHTILLDCERMKYPHTGLYHFCLHLGKNLLETAANDRQFCFYTPASAIGAFGKEAHYLQQNSLQKFRLPSTKNFSIWHNTYQSSSYFPKHRNLKIILTIHDLNFLYDSKKNELKKRNYLQKLKAKIERADHIVAISEFTLNDVISNIDIGNKPYSIVYNGCNVEQITSLTMPAVVPSRPFLFTIGTIIEKKNFHVLPCLLANNDWQLVIAGFTQSEAYKSCIITEAGKYGVADRVIFTGPISENDKQWYLQKCTAFVFPSIAEGFGLPVVEAMYFGKPLLLSTFTSLPEIGGDVAYYFNSFEPAAMQQTLEESLHDYNVKKPQKAIQERSTLFSWQRSALQYHAIYNSLLR